MDIVHHHHWSYRTMERYSSHLVSLESSLDRKSKYITSLELPSNMRLAYLKNIVMNSIWNQLTEELNPMKRFT